MTKEAPERFIPVFVDVKPNEDLRPHTGQTICFVGLLSNTMDGVEGLKQYKKTRTTSRKVKAAKKIVEALNSGSLQIDGIALAGRMNGQFVKWACDTINRNREKLGATWEVEGSTPTVLLWNDHRYPRDCVLGLSTYASLLPFIALRAATICKGSSVSKIKMALDQLPYCSDRGTQFLNAVTESDPDILDMWKRNGDYGHSFEFGVFESYRDEDGGEISGKEHPNSILVDWLAASCMAKVNPEQLKQESGFDDDEVQAIAAIWSSLSVYGSESIRDLDDPILIQKVQEHEAKRVQTS